MEVQKVKSKIKVIILILVSFIFISLVIGYTYINSLKKQINKSVFFEGIYINDIPVGGLTKKEADKKIEEYIRKMQEKKITIECCKQSNNVSIKKLGLQIINKQEVLNNAFNYGKEGNIFTIINKKKEIKKNLKKYKLKIILNDKRIEQYLNEIKNNFSKEAKNAIIQRTNNKFQIQKETLGMTLDIKASKKRIKDLLSENFKNPIKKIELILEVIKPKYTQEYYTSIKDILGTFATPYNASNTMRTENLKVAAKKLNGKIIHPGYVFSTHDALSPINLKNGYKPAPIIIQGKVKDGMGGGVCQVATTLYNAILFSELEVLERNNHSMKVSYAEKGRDAAIAGNILDFKFRNNTNNPIYIESYLKDKKLFTTIYGLEKRDSQRKIEFESVVINKISPPPKQIIYDSTMPKGKKDIVQKEINGYKVKLYKKIFINNQLRDKVLVNYSYYRPSPTIIKIGQKDMNKKQIEAMSHNTNKKDEEKKRQQVEEVIDYNIEESNTKEDKETIKKEETIIEKNDDQEKQNKQEEINNSTVNKEEQILEIQEE